ncbi:hypothetical protein HPB50_004095 [Hyalomma asiaticum]|uniref:Uncharacterized protein n=1 Tax=Hyalomma asiaticum TaxID=266040 RepID=A0ACB7TGR7_HYAAI|nr:hypothetical protein HPB50_004095 [Hyalomma asiaticum]
MTDVMSVPTPVPTASSEPSCDAVTTTDCGDRLVFSNPTSNLIAGTPAIAMLLQRRCFFGSAPFHRTNGIERTEDEGGRKDLDCVSALELQLNGLSISGVVFSLLEAHEAHCCLDAEKRFPSSDSLTGLYTIYRGASFCADRRYCSLCTVPVERTQNLGRLDGWVVVTLPRLHANTSFEAAMEHWCGEPKLLEASPLCITSSHRHDCDVKKGAITPSALPRFVVRQTDSMLMLVFYTAATNPSTVSGSFCECKSAFQIVFCSYNLPGEVRSVAMATPFAKDSLANAYKVVSLQKTLFLFLYKAESAVGTWKTFYIGTDFDNLQALEMESSDAVRTSLTKRLSRQTRFSKCNSFESPENKAEDKTNLVSKAPLVSRQQRSLSESSAYQIPEVSRRGILKNGTDWRRTTSESSDEFLSSLSFDSDTSFPASSLESVQPKKTVSFNDHISHIVYRYIIFISSS